MTKIPYGRQYISKEDIKAVISVLESDLITQGPVVDQFERKFADYIGSKYAVAVANGTAALHLSALAVDVKPGSRVITTPITFAASANCIRYCGAYPVFADIKPDTYNIDLAKVEELLEKAPEGYYSGIIPVDLAGHPVNMQELRTLAKKYNLWIIEDSCHAPGAWYTDKSGNKHYSGNCEFTDLAIFSFHPVKHIATGEGGMITTNNEELYKKLIMLRTHGITKNPEHLYQNHGGWYYEMHLLGYNYRLTDIQSALGISQLSKAKENLLRRNEIADIYDDAFSSLDIVTPFRTDDIFHAFHLYIIKTSQRKELYEYLKANNIFCQVHYIPVHLQPYYQDLGWKAGDLPEAERYYNTCLSIPMYPSIKESEQQFVIDKIKEFENEQSSNNSCQGRK